MFLLSQLKLIYKAKNIKYLLQHYRESDGVCILRRSLGKKKQIPEHACLLGHQEPPLHLVEAPNTNAHTELEGGHCSGERTWLQSDFSKAPPQSQLAKKQVMGPLDKERKAFNF